jgi:hypothetical protein
MVLEALERLSGPRRVLLGCAALLVAVSTLPWYHYSVRGLTFEQSGWHEIGVLAWILAAEVVVWEVVRVARLAPIGGDRGDRYSAVGGMATAFVGLLFVLRRGIDGDLGYAWILGAILIAGLGWASWILFIASAGPAAVDARLGRGPAPEESRPDDGRPAPVRPAPAENWRRVDDRPAVPAPHRSTPTLPSGTGAAPAWSSIEEPRPGRPARSFGRGATPAWQATPDRSRRREDLPPWRGGPRSADPGRDRTTAWESAVERDEDVPPWRRPAEPSTTPATPERHVPRLPRRDRPRTRDGDDLPPWRGGGRPDPPGGRPAWRGGGGAGTPPVDGRPSIPEQQRKQPPLW